MPMHACKPTELYPGVCGVTLSVHSHQASKPIKDGVIAWKEQKSTTRDEVECRGVLFFPRYGVFCDLLQHTRTLKRNPFVLYIK